MGSNRFFLKTRMSAGPQPTAAAPFRDLREVFQDDHASSLRQWSTRALLLSLARRRPGFGRTPPPQGRSRRRGWRRAGLLLRILLLDRLDLDPFDASPDDRSAVERRREIGQARDLVLDRERLLIEEDVERSVLG